MTANAQRSVRDYCDDRTRHRRGWPVVERPSPGPWEDRRAHRKIQRAAPESLETLLAELVGDDFGQRLPSMRQGRERRFLEREPLVAAIRSERDARDTIETHLDGLFDDLVAGERFRHTEAVMCLLLATKLAHAEYFDEMSKAFADAPTSEVGQLRRFAIALRNE